MSTRLKDKIFKLVNSCKKIPVEKKSPKTILEIFNRPYDENFISDYLVYILDPFENGIGIEPLRRLLDSKDKDNIYLPLLEGIDKDDIEIDREHRFKNGRRIDILIKIKDKMVIGIENKIYSLEGNRQTIDYFKSITKEIKLLPPDDESRPLPPILFFLTPSKDLPQSKLFIPISYSELINYLSQIDINTIRDPHCREIFKDFLFHIRKKIMTDKSYRASEKFKLYVENVKCIADLEDNFQREVDDFMEYLFEKIKSLYRQNNDDQWEFSFGKRRDYHQVYRSHWDNKKFFLHFEYWFTSEQIFKDRKIQFMIEVEGKKKDLFLNKFRPTHSRLNKKYAHNGIQFRPQSRTRAVAYKEYRFNAFSEKFEDEVLRVFKRSFNDFKFLIPYLDKIMENF